jgi:hypothetical protein
MHSLKLVFLSPFCKLWVLVFGLVGLASFSFAQVTNLNDSGSGSLREVISTAADGSLITFQAGLSGTILLTTGELTISQDDLVIDGSGATIRIDGQNASRILNHTGAGTLEVIGLTLQNGSATGNGGAIDSAGSVIVQNSAIFNSNATVLGGGVSSAGNTVVENSIVSGNTSGSVGGGVRGQDNSVVINSIISGNSTFFGGGGVYTDNLTTDITNSLISGNSANFGAGGIDGGGDVTVTNSTIVANIGGSAGGIAVFTGAVILNNSLVLGNSGPTPNVDAGGGIILNSSAYGFATGESTGNTFVGRFIDDVFVAPEPATNAPTSAGNYRLSINSPAVNSGDNTRVPATVIADLEGNTRIQAGQVDMGAYELAIVSSSIINPTQDIQVRNGDSTDADVITSNSLVPLSYGPYKRNETVVLEYLVRNPGAQTLELGELVLPTFMSTSGDNLPERLGSFESALLTVAVDTSAAGTLAGQVSLTSNDPDANENPLVFNVVLMVKDDPANALYVLPGVRLADVTVTKGQQDVPMYSFRLLVPESSVPVAIDAISLNLGNLPARGGLTALHLYIDGGTRGELDRNDVPLATLTNLPVNDDGSISFTIPERTLLPDVPMWFLVTGDF